MYTLEKGSIREINQFAYPLSGLADNPSLVAGKQTHHATGGLESCLQLSLTEHNHAARDTTDRKKYEYRKESCLKGLR